MPDPSKMIDNLIEQLESIHAVLTLWVSESGPSKEGKTQEFFQGNIRALAEAQGKILHDLIDWTHLTVALTAAAQPVQPPKKQPFRNKAKAQRRKRK